VLLRCVLKWGIIKGSDSGAKLEFQFRDLTRLLSPNCFNAHLPFLGEIGGKHQVIIHAEAFGNSQDYAHMPPSSFS
jgi:hypothetical protein